MLTIYQACHLLSAYDMLDTVLSAIHIILFNLYSGPEEVNILPILQMRQLRFQECSDLPGSHRKWLSQPKFVLSTKIQLTIKKEKENFVQAKLRVVTQETLRSSENHSTC